ncbi:MAG: hypothetical protein AAF593_09155 [Planctomycetota bacterium]
MTHNWANGIHVTACLILGITIWAVRWAWAGLQSEYGHRGPNGEYLYDLSNPATILQVNLTGITAALLAAAIYWLIVWRVRKSKA